jgi:hypothetical protein
LKSYLFRGYFIPILPKIALSDLINARFALPSENLKTLELTMYTPKYLNNFTKGKIEPVAEVMLAQVASNREPIHRQNDFLC